jgi:outer membrane receptor protein involved in Fe transport
VLTVQTDYVRPLDEFRKVEFGAKSNTRDIFNDQKYFTGTGPDSLTPVNAQTSNFSYNEQIVAGYGIWQQKVGKLGYQVGLRYEQTFINTRFGNSDGTKFTPRDYGNLIPTININYSLNATHEFQLSYAQRLNRPGPGSLNPFTDYTDPNTLRVGNPNLNPERIHAFEANWQLNTQAITLTSTAFYRYNATLITRVIDVDTNGRAVVTEVNTGTRQDAGTEFTGRWQIKKGYSLTGNTSFYYSYINAPSVSNGLVNENFNYTFRLTGSALVRPGTNVQATAFYRSPFIIPQGTSRPFYNVDIAVSQDFLKKKASVSLAVNDVFNTLRFGINSADNTFKQSFKRKRETQIATLSLTYRFGSVDNLSRRRETRSPNSGGGGDFGF